MKTLILIATLVSTFALALPASADRWRDEARYRHDERRYHDYRHFDDRRHYGHRKHHDYRDHGRYYRGHPGSRVIVRVDRHRGHHHHHHRHDDDALKWIAGTLIIREILHHDH